MFNRSKKNRNIVFKKRKKYGGKRKVNFIFRFLLNRYFFVVIFCCVVFIYKFAYVQESFDQFKNSFLKKTVSVGLEVKDIVVEGYKRTSKGDILKAIAVKKGDPILSFDPQKVKSTLESFSWIKSASVQRKLDGVIYVRILEKVPIALWQKKSNLFIIDDEGSIIKNQDISKFSSLIVLVGENAEQNASKFLKALSNQPFLRKRATSAIFIGNRRWDLILGNKLKVKLPEQDIEKALSFLVKLEKDKYLNDDIISIDIRFSDRLFFYLSPKAMAKRRRTLDKYI